MKSIMKKIMYALVVIVIISCLSASYYYIKENNYFIYATGSDKKALLNSTWLMSPNEIRRSNNAYLKRDPYKLPPLLLLSDNVGPDIVNQERFSYLMQDGLSFWGRPATVDYEFFDNKLYRYYITFRVYDLESTELEVLSSLKGKLGEFKEIESKYYIRKYEWNSNNLFVLFGINKITEHEYGFHMMFKYLPFYTEIEKISKVEKAEYFGPQDTQNINPTPAGKEPELTIIVNAQAADGVTQTHMDQNFLNNLEEYLITRSEEKMENHYKSRGLPVPELKILAESNYIELGSTKLAIVRIFEEGVSNSALILGVKGDEVLRVFCASRNTYQVEVSTGECGKKIEDTFGVSFK